MIAVANAPVSYGAFEITVGIDPNVPDPRDAPAVGGRRRICRHRPRPGRLPRHGRAARLAPVRARARDRRRLLRAPVQRTGGARRRAARARRAARRARRRSAPTRSHPSRRWPTPAHPRARVTRAGPLWIASVGLDDAGWKAFADGLARAAERCRERGYEPTFHHHTATYVEAQWEIERMLELSDVGLCLDTGHLLLGRGDPLVALREWRDRINQLHLKDARLATLEQIVSEAAPVQEIWRTSCVLRTGRGRHRHPRRARRDRRERLRGLARGRAGHPARPRQPRAAGDRPAAQPRVPARAGDLVGLDGRVRIALVGAGRMGSVHLDALRRSEVIEPAGVVEPVAAVRQALAADGLEVYESVDRLLDGGGIEGVLIAVPSDQHRDIVRAFAAARIPMLCEKPLGIAPRRRRRCGPHCRRRRGATAGRLLAAVRPRAARAAPADSRR